jgi:hypothetical protein
MAKPPDAQSGLGGSGGSQSLIDDALDDARTLRCRGDHRPLILERQLPGVNVYRAPPDAGQNSCTLIAYLRAEQCVADFSLRAPALLPEAVR